QHKTLEPAALDRVVKTCVATDPEERWQSAREVKLALGWLSDAGVPSNFKPASNRFRFWAIAAIAATVLAGVWIMGARRESTP
ncbi:hypothetical protein AB9E19_34020, partial [Rhizobium leguminosarum]|uniref:hypothetical protein n=1 Tax=Rhizobium leguminosarum TaxID=384 RepID=UPI003F9B2E7F